ncbi:MULTISPECIES: hypothetical protein [Jiangella]|uniref:Uncharacterized protein n=1 Tax=Jiangella alba TaxID=561176 RepID=A0A1H5PMF7_9ACTN|nr:MULTISPECIES: hypothetical protein [Jiangella]SDT68704.1 hypothetical protein SAMN04515669_5910 [Jiangella sp. DSM 45060]SEF14894.1 hypothetical protein SAMN04488561_4773 [Jiangella alba]
MSLITGLTATAPDLATSSITIQAGLLDWTTDTASSLQTVLRVVAITVAILFVVYKAVNSKFAIGTIIVSALAAGVFIWIVYNVTALRDTVGEDLPGSAPVSQQVDLT